MELNAYQEEAYRTALPSCRNLTYMVLGLCNEGGEVAGKLKKVIRGDRSLENAKEDFGLELGDALWYIACAAKQAGFTLDQIAQTNIKKLHDRELRGKLQGDGDVR